MDPEEDDSKDIYIVHLKKKGAITKVKEFVHDPKCKKYLKFKIVIFYSYPCWNYKRPLLLC